MRYEPYIFKSMTLTEGISKDVIDAVMWHFGFNKKEAKEYILSADDKLLQSLVAGYKDQYRKDFLYDNYSTSATNIINERYLKEYHNYRTQPNYNLAIQTGLSDIHSENVLKSVKGQLSDGIWENSPSMEKYWKFFKVSRDSSGPVIEVDTQSPSSGFYNKSEDQIKKWIAGKVKQIVKEEIKDHPNAGITWDRNNAYELLYMHDGVTVRDAYKVYDRLMGRKDRIKESICNSNKSLSLKEGLNYDDLTEILYWCEKMCDKVGWWSSSDPAGLFLDRLFPYLNETQIQYAISDIKDDANNEE